MEIVEFIKDREMTKIKKKYYVLCTKIHQIFKKDQQAK